MALPEEEGLRGQAAIRRGAGEHAPRLNVTIHDFKFGKVLGRGSFSKVVMAQLKGTNEVVALKIMDKRHIIREQKVLYVKRERAILDELRHPGVPELHFSFQDDYSLYIGLECCTEGELYDQIRLHGKLSYEAARFYAAEVVDILEYIHSKGVVHRDLKPENLLLTEAGHLKLVDFGSAKLLKPLESQPSLFGQDADDKNGSFVGTAEYVSPEVLTSKAVSESADLWALGCLIYQMLVGAPPFHAASEYLVFQRVMAIDYRLPDEFPPIAKDLISKLLVEMPERRLGAGPRGLAALKAHAFFKGVDWARVRDAPAPPMLHPPEPAGVDFRSGGLSDVEQDDEVDEEWERALMAGAMARMNVRERNQQRHSPSPESEAIHGARDLAASAATPVVADQLRGSPRASCSASPPFSAASGAPESPTSPSCILSPSPSSPSSRFGPIRTHRITDEVGEEMWLRFLRPGERLVVTSLVKKHRLLSVKKRQLMLMSPPRLIYVDPVLCVQMGEIPWSNDLQVIVDDPIHFSIRTPKRTYVLEELKGQAWQWKEAIEELRRQHQ